MTSPTTSRLIWAIRTLAKAFETGNDPILGDPRLTQLRDSVTRNTDGCGTYAGTYIRFLSEIQALRFHCVSPTYAREIAELTGGFLHDSRVVVLAPEAVFRQRSGKAP